MRKYCKSPACVGNVFVWTLYLALFLTSWGGGEVCPHPQILQIQYLIFRQWSPKWNIPVGFFLTKEESVPRFLPPHWKKSSSEPKMHYLFVCREPPPFRNNCLHPIRKFDPNSSHFVEAPVLNNFHRLYKTGGSNIR